jgi:thiol-disulfide isomerase/thioredoxin
MKKIVYFLLLSFVFVACSNPKKEEKKVIKEDKVGLQIGKTFPSFNIQKPDGEWMTTEEFKGKTVFIDFWASWCKPCRNANKTLVENYAQWQEKYKSKGKTFEIVQLSFDGGKKNIEEHKSKWLKAVKEDSLYWPNHGSDLKGWDSPLISTYSIDYIPYSYLLDEEGKIIAIDVEVHDLDSVITSVLN